MYIGTHFTRSYNPKPLRGLRSPWFCIVKHPSLDRLDVSSPERIILDPDDSVGWVIRSTF